MNSLRNSSSSSSSLVRLQIKNLSYSYPLLDSAGTSSRLPILENVNFEIMTGESLSIQGKSGQGKTTLLSLLSLLETPTAGQIIDTQLGIDLCQLPEKKISKWRAHTLGLVFQNYYLIESLTALENILLVAEVLKLDNAQERAWSLLKKIKMEDRADHYPHQLSGGESQRVAVARALIHEPAIIMADEPSGNLDESTGSEVMDLLFSLVQSINSSLILVTHDSELARRCDRHFTLVNYQLSLV